MLDRSGGMLRLHGLVKGDPDAAMVAVDDAFGAAGVSITDVHFFSGVQVTLHFEGPPEHVAPLVAGLAEAGVELDRGSLDAAAEASSLDRPVAGTLVVVLLRGDPDLRREVPAVPG